MGNVEVAYRNIVLVTNMHARSAHCVREKFIDL